MPRHATHKQARLNKGSAYRGGFATTSQPHHTLIQTQATYWWPS